ncbi:MAG: NADH-quinone oxidoreductase subunit G [Gammaproteobacteria bacterium]|nr:NADH-quinone oxidoreductase subunit G [Gammaproteobacteria bacterium]
MTQDKCTIQVNGLDVEARPGQMLIEVTDAAGIYVPRFCYHDKLSIAANCRMCLVEVENAPKPLPACATPVTPGMKVHTRSQKAIGAQKATMEFLLINHPLDCPICDQGGECELQDLAMGFGRDVSRFVERKRVVRDKDIGPLIATEMTRCIHCTRCVRFTQEIAGFQELGTIGRGDRVEISPFIERSIGHELSGNIIDLCPVGALTSKPFRFAARAWEMSQHPTIAPHDCLGSQVYAHVMDGRVKRVVPRACEEINETWLSDRDRFSYQGLQAADRLQQPMVRDAGTWRTVEWDEALAVVANRLSSATGKNADAALGALVSPGATAEEGFLLAQLMEHVGSASIDHRLRRRDFRNQQAEPRMPGLGMPIAAVEQLDQVLVVGSNLRHEVPLLAHRIRKAALRGAVVNFVNAARYPYLFPVGQYLEGQVDDFWLELVAILKAAAPECGLSAPAAAWCAGAPEPTDAHRAVATGLRAGERAAILLGLVARRHPRFAEIRLVAAELARVTGARLGELTEGSNAAGLALAGVLPHRSAGGVPRQRAGADAGRLAVTPPSSMILFGVEPEQDCGAIGADWRADFVVAFSAFDSAWLRQHADVLLPIAMAFETAGTYVNAEGRWQSFEAVARPPGEARPGWKVLRVLARLMHQADVDYDSCSAIREDLRACVEAAPAIPDGIAEALPAVPATAPVRLDDIDVPIYRIDGLVRRADALQQAGASDQDAAHPGRRRA